MGFPPLFLCLYYSTILSISKIHCIYSSLNFSYSSVVSGKSKRYNKVTLGNANPKYGDAQKQYVKQQNEETATALEQVIISTTQSITGNNGGYIVMHPAEKPQEILIMDTPDTNTAQRIWRWDLSGLSYSSSGVEG